MGIIKLIINKAVSCYISLVEHQSIYIMVVRVTHQQPMPRKPLWKQWLILLRLLDLGSGIGTIHIRQESL